MTPDYTDDVPIERLDLVVDPSQASRPDDADDHAA
jgi:hypothetical protein